MNRKGDLSSVFLVVIALVLSGITLFTLVSFNDVFAEKSKERNEVLGNVLFFRDFIVEEGEIYGRRVISEEEANLKRRFIELVVDSDVGIKGLEDYYERIAKGDFDFVGEGEVYILRMDDLVIDLEEGGNRIKKTFSFEIEFDSRGGVVRRVVGQGLGEAA